MPTALRRVICRHGLTISASKVPSSTTEDIVVIDRNVCTEECDEQRRREQEEQYRIEVEREMRLLAPLDGIDTRTKRIIGSMISAIHDDSIHSWKSTAAHFLNLNNDQRVVFYRAVDEAIDAAMEYAKESHPSIRRSALTAGVVMNLCPNGLDIHWWQEPS